jgi:hypothetical protein
MTGMSCSRTHRRRWRRISSRPVSLLRSWRVAFLLEPVWRDGRGARTSQLLLVLCLTFDLLLISADVMYRNNLLRDVRFLLTRERGFGEMLQYLKLGTIAVVLLIWSARLRSAAAAIFALLFAYISVDDAFSAHERAGALLAGVLPAAGPLDPAHLGELLYLALLAASVAVPVAYLAWVGDRQQRRIIALLTGCVALLAVPGVGLDLLHSLVHAHRPRVILAVLEDGGEMVAATFVLVLAVAHMPPGGPMTAVPFTDSDGTAVHPPRAGADTPGQPRRR